MLDKLDGYASVIVVQRRCFLEAISEVGKLSPVAAYEMRTIEGLAV